MKVHYEGKEQIAAPYDAAWKFMTASDKVSTCLPDVLSTEIADDKNFTSVVRVGVGPVKGKFTFQVGLEPKPDEHIVGVKMHGGGMGSVVDLQANAVMADDGGSATTLTWSADAVVNGPVATIGGRILDAQAKRIIEYVFTSVKETLGKEQGAKAGSG
jgi:uncharacterized protein